MKSEACSGRTMKTRCRNCGIAEIAVEALQNCKIAVKAYEIVEIKVEDLQNRCEISTKSLK